MKYFSMFTGVGGFELGIQQAYDNKEEQCKICEDWLPINESGRCDECAYAYEFTESGRPKQSELEYKSTMADIASKRTEQSTATCVGFSEIDKYASQLLSIKWPHVKNYGDATKINEYELPDFDLLVGGFPCQSFSVAGKRGGFNDTRGTLFFDIARILKHKRPEHLVLENVKGLLSHDGGRTFQTIIRILTDLGYFVEWQVLNSKNFGVPQNRERVFIVGHLGEEPRPKVFPISGESGEDKRRMGKEVSYALDANYHKGTNTLAKSRRQVVRQPLKFLQRNQKNIEGDYSFTIDSVNTGGVRIENRVRRLTPLECERLQGFPDNWTEGFSDTQRYKMMGNAVTVNVVRHIINNLYA